MESICSIISRHILSLTFDILGWWDKHKCRESTHQSVKSEAKNFVEACSAKYLEMENRKRQNKEKTTFQWQKIVEQVYLQRIIQFAQMQATLNIQQISVKGFWNLFKCWIVGRYKYFVIIYNVIKHSILAVLFWNRMRYLFVEKLPGYWSRLFSVPSAGLHL